MIFISHKLDEVLGNADAITVIRAGRTVGEVDDPSSVTSRQLAEMMVGSELPSPETREKTIRPEVLLEVRNLTVGGDSSEVSFNQLGKGDAASQAVVTQASTTSESTVPASTLRALDRVSFEVHAGEIVGIAGVEGNGQTELSRRSWACATPAGRCCWTARTSASWRRSTVGWPASATCRRTASRTAWC